MTENEFIEHIRSIFVDYTEFCPTYSTVKDALTTHYEECCCAHHWFFETEAVCMSPITTSQGSSLLISKMLDIYNHIKFLPKKKKEEIIRENVFNLQVFDEKSIRVNLSPPHFERCITALQDYLEVNKQTAMIRNLSLNNFKAHLHFHLKKCKGPCILNDFGYPVCLFSQNQQSAMDKMMCGVILLANNFNLKDPQETFDIALQPHKYNYFINYVRQVYDTNFIYHF